MQMLDYLEAAACLWEDFIRKNQCEDSVVRNALDEWGWSHCRLCVVGLASELLADFAKVQDTYDMSFDWDFTPYWLSKKLDEKNIFASG